MEKRIAPITAILILILALPLGAQSQDDTDIDQIMIQLFIEETVVVVVRGGWIDRTITIEDFAMERYVDFGRFEILTGAITDYEVRTSAEAVVRKGLSVQEIDVEPLQIRLVKDEMTGMTCPPSSKRVQVNEKVVEFIDAVSAPDSHLLFEGCNNTANNTVAPIEARVDLADLPGDVVTTGAAVVFTINFIVIER